MTRVRARRVATIAAATAKRYRLDEGGQLAATIAFYGFFSLFPLLLVLVTIASWFLADDPELQQRALDSVLTQFPVVGDEIRENLGSIQGSGLAFAVGLIGAVWGGLGVMQALQGALNRIWRLPVSARPAFVRARARSLTMLAVLGLAVIVSTVLSAWGAELAGAPAARVGLLAGSLLVAAGMFAAAFRLLVAAPVAWAHLWPGVVLASVAWVALQTIGVVLVSRYLRHASALYGVFGLVIGLLWWMYLLATITVLAAELNAVTAQGSLRHAATEVDERLAQDP